MEPSDFQNSTVTRASMIFKDAQEPGTQQVQSSTFTLLEVKNWVSVCEREHRETVACEVGTLQPTLYAVRKQSAQQNRL